MTTYFYGILFPPADFILGCWVGAIVSIGFSFGGVSGLVRTLDTGQGTAQGLDNPAELPFGDAVVPCHKLDSLNTSADFQKQKNKSSLLFCG